MTKTLDTVLCIVVSLLGIAGLWSVYVISTKALPDLFMLLMGIPPDYLKKDKKKMKKKKEK